MPAVRGGGNVKKKEKKKDPRWGSALIDNIAETARGIGPGIKAIGTGLYNDADYILGDQLPGRHSTSFELDAVGRAVKEDYRKRYMPLFHGDYVQFKDEVATNPLSYILDVATLFSGGGAALGKAGEVAAISGAAASKGSLAAKLAKSAGFVERDAASLERAARAYGISSKEIREGSKSGMIRGVREIGGRAAADGRIGKSLVRPSKRNAVLRRRDELIDKVLEHPKMDRVPIVGLESRVARNISKAPNLAADARRSETVPAIKAVRKLDGPELVAWGVLHEGVDREAYINVLEKARDTGELSDVDQKLVTERIKKLQDDDVRQLIEKPSDRLAHAVKQTQSLANDVMAPLLHDVSGIDERTLIARRMMPKRITQGAERVTEHPSRVVPMHDRILQDVADGGRGDLPRLLDAPERADIGRPELTGHKATDEQVKAYLDAEERRLVRGRSSRARASIRRWLGQIYDEYRYGTADPGAAVKRADAGVHAAARARVARRAKTGAVPGILDLDKVIDKYGAFSREAARLVDDAGPMRQKLWARLREARGADRNFVTENTGGGLDRKIAEAGYHPSDRLSNLPGDDGMAEKIDEWMQEATGDVDIADIAHGHIGGDVGTTIDQVEAQGLIAEAKRLDPSLPENPSNSDVAYALALKYSPLDEPSNMLSKKDFSAQMLDSVMRAFIDDPKHFDIEAEFPEIHGPLGRALADRLGIRSAQDGIEPSERDWVKALSEVARRAGFDDNYVRDARTLKDARARYLKDGPAAFHGRFKPEPLTDARGKQTSELLNPETRQLYSEEDAARPLEELAAEAEGTAYKPHLAPKGAHTGFGTARASGPVRREPRLASNITHASTGRRFETGVYEDGPGALIKQSRNVSKGKLAKDLYDVGVDQLGVPFDKAKYLDRGGSKHWVVADPKGVRALSQRLGNFEGVFDELKDLLPEDKVTEFVRDLRKQSDTLANQADELGDNGLIMMPRGAYEKLTESLNESGAFAKNVVDKPLDVFRSMVLFTRPAYYVNNVVSQNLLLAIRDGGPGFMRDYISFLAGKNMNGARDLFRMGATDPTSTAKLWDEFLDTHFPSGKNASVGSVERGTGTMTERMSMSGKRSQKIVAAIMRSPQAANDIGSVLSDDLTRQFRFIRLIQPHVKAAIRDGETGSAPEIAMRLLDKDPVLRDRITEQTLFDLVDYRGMSDFERKVMRRIIPFYGWMRGISMWTAELGFNHPDQLLALATVGKIGEDANAEWNEITPDWLHGSVRFGDGDPEQGTQKVLGTQGLNPFSTIADISTLARGAFGDRPAASLTGGTTAGQINPYMRILLQATMNKGKDFSTGMPMLMPGQSMANRDNQQWPGWAATSVGGFIGSMPQSMLASNVRTALDNQRTMGRPSSATSVYRSPYQEYLSSYAGLPLRTVNLQGAMARRLKDEKLLAGEGSVFG